MKISLHSKPPFHRHSLISSLYASKNVEVEWKSNIVSEAAFKP